MGKRERISIDFATSLADRMVMISVLFVAVLFFLTFYIGHDHFAIRKLKVIIDIDINSFTMTLKAANSPNAGLPDVSLQADAIHQSRPLDPQQP